MNHLARYICVEAKIRPLTNDTIPKTNKKQKCHEHELETRKGRDLFFQASFFRGKHVSFNEGICIMEADIAVA